VKGKRSCSISKS